MIVERHSVNRHVWLYNVDSLKRVYSPQTTKQLQFVM